MNTKNNDQIEQYIKNRVHDLYYGIDMNCARTTMTCLSQLLDFKIEEQTMDAALGMHGAGGFRAQCGLVEGSLMTFGIYGKMNGKTDPEVVEACYEYGKQFTEKFGSLTCRELRPGGFLEDDPPHLCEQLTCESIYFTYCYLKDWMNKGMERDIIHG